MKCEEALKRLDDYVDGLLPPRERDDVNGHLQSCPACRARADGLLRLLESARALARPVQPPEDLWPGVSGRISERRTRHRVVANAPDISRPRRWLSLAAALALVAGTSLATAWLVGRRTVEVQPAHGKDLQNPVVSPLAPEEIRLERERRQLLAVFRTSKARLRPSTAKVVERNLRIIDRSLSDIESALRKDPGNEELAFLLAGTYRQELDLLRQAVRLSNNDWTGGKNEKS